MAQESAPREVVDAPPQISPNRPTFSDGTSLVPLGYVQLETGWMFARRTDSSAETLRHNGPEVLLRVRVAESLETRLQWNGVVWSEVDVPTSDGHDLGGSDVALAIVVPVFAQQDSRPAIAIELLSTLGVGDQAFSSEHADPTAKLLWSYGGGHLPDWLGIGGNLIASWPTEAGDRFTQTAASVYATFTAPGPDTCWFAEWFVVSPPANNLESTQSVDFGVVQRLSPRIAVDARIGFGLDERADDVFGGLGISFLL